VDLTEDIATPRAGDWPEGVRPRTFGSTSHRTLPMRAFPAPFVLLAALAACESAGTPRILPNDNLVAAGRLRDSTLTLAIEARVGRWFPDEDRRDSALVVAAFGIKGKPPSIPGPLIRVRSGTRIRVRVRNRLDSLPLFVHGLQSHPAASDDTLQVAAGATREIEFTAGAPGTYFYWASTDDETIEERLRRDSQLSGALIVDPPTGAVSTDRIFVLGVMDLNPPGATADTPSAPFAAVINGRSWPSTERMNLAVGDTVHWRWINPSGDNHPMHLHGFYYRVDSRGTSLADTIYDPEQRRQVVTERLSEGTTMAMTWSPERAGQWLMHCHLHFHVAPSPGWGPDYPRIRNTAATQPGEHRMDDMAGLVLGINVSSSAPPAPAPVAARRVRLVVEPMAAGPKIQVRQEEAGQETAPASSPGAPLVLTRGETAEVTVVNHMPAATAMHWHGIELESYYDGVPGWSGTAERPSPMIAPGDSFVARMTPPRPGTFIYHAHNLATDQVGHGLVGALIVLEPLEVRRAQDEIIWIVGGNDIFITGHLEINGQQNPGTTLAFWRPLAKDAISVAPGLMKLVLATVRTSVGETYDYEFDSGAPRHLTLLVRNDGKPMASQLVEIR
jgi:FtsP/CotA-like multicopper oxidase with cupredoxin domain